MIIHSSKGLDIVVNKTGQRNGWFINTAGLQFFMFGVCLTILKYNWKRKTSFYPAGLSRITDRQAA